MENLSFNSSLLRNPVSNPCFKASSVKGRVSFENLIRTLQLEHPFFFVSSAVSYDVHVSPHPRKLLFITSMVSSRHQNSWLWALFSSTNVLCSQFLDWLKGDKLALITYSSEHCRMKQFIETSESIRKNCLCFICLSP